MELQKRKKIRLDGFDYSQNGVYFVTMCIHNKQMMLWENVEASCVLTNKLPKLPNIGKTVANEIQKLNDI